ncbi:hypothetical protein AB0O47_16745 [Streptomyces noursei]|uniref:hypothetical protein n=1 Tax=Streptomyces noursei TaxID=1971 RepID=UPI003450FD5C
MPTSAQAADKDTTCTGETREVYGNDRSVWTKAEACYQVRDDVVYPVYRFRCQYKWGGVWYSGKTCTVRMEANIQQIYGDKKTVHGHLVAGSGTGTFDVAGDRGLSCAEAADGFAMAGGFNADQYWDSSAETNPHGDLPIAHIYDNVCR